MKKFKCSNCGKSSKYTEREIDEAYPYSREKLICLHCKHFLSVCGGFIENIKS